MSNQRPAKKQPMSAAQRADAKAKLDAKNQRRAERKEAEKQAALEKARKARNTRIGAILAVVVVVGLVIFAITKFTGDDRPVVAPKNIDGHAVVVGEESAPTTVTIYEDLQCPACASLEGAFGEQVNAAIEAGTVKVEYRLVSFLDNASRNEYSSRAANVLMAVLDTAGVDAFKSLHDTLYAQQPAEGTAGPENDELIDLAVAAGADADAIRAAVEDGKFVPWITKSATEQWSKDGYTSTPTVLVNGEQIDNQTLGQYLVPAGTDEGSTDQGTTDEGSTDSGSKDSGKQDSGKQDSGKKDSGKK